MELYTTILEGRQYSYYSESEVILEIIQVVKEKSFSALCCVWKENVVFNTAMTHQNHQTNGASLEDCHTNFYALVSRLRINCKSLSVFRGKIFRSLV